MKWGVRRSPEQLGHAPKKNKRVSIKISSESKKISAKSTSSKSSGEKKSIKSMSDEDLRKAIARIEMERKYATLTAKQKSKGRKLAEEIIGNAAKQTATKYTAQAMDNLVKKMLNNRSGNSGGGH